MGQREIIGALEDKGWMTKTEIAEQLQDYNIAGINHCLLRLIKGNFILVKKDKRFRHAFLYKINNGDEKEEEPEDKG